MYVKHTGQLLEKIEQSLERDHFMSPFEAQTFGIIDKVLTSPPKNNISDEQKIITEPPSEVK